MQSKPARKLLVTGASRGIGAAITRRLLYDGFQVVGIGRDFSAWDPLPAGLQVIQLDLSDLPGLPRRLGEIARAQPDLDGLILNAGYGRFGSLEEFSYAQIQRMVDTNLTQHIFLARALLPQLKRRPGGDLIIIGSEAALAGGRRGAVYAACKFGLRGLAQSLRAECSGSGLRVCLINPGMVESGFFDTLGFAPGEAPQQHLRPEDIASTVAMVLQAPPGTVYDEINLNPLQRVVRFKGP